MPFYWGDIHNHNEMGIARGSLERALDIARRHLDFWVIVPHGHQQGMHLMPSAWQSTVGWKARRTSGNQRVRDRWPEVLRMVREADDPGRFVTLLGYEWHSRQWGDHVLYYPQAEGQPVNFDDIRELQAYAREKGCLLIPHHLGYPCPGATGHDWSTHDPAVTPVAEIYSEHGACERDTGTYPMVSHSWPGRVGDNCAQAGLARGLRFGFVASTDGHLGFPGAYPEGLVGVDAPELTREAVWDALRARRTIAVTGDRIQARLHVNGAPMGSELPWTGERRIEIDIVGWDEIDKVELLKNNEVLERFYPALSGDGAWPERVKVRMEAGWGRWAQSRDLAVTPWKVSVQVQEGCITDAMPCFRSRPFLEEDRPGIKALATNACSWRAHTAQRYAVEGIQCFERANTQGLVLELSGGPDTRLSVALSQPVERAFEVTLGDLARGAHIEPTGPLVGESVVLHRLLWQHQCMVSAETTDPEPSQDCADWYYLRVTQANGQMAWTSPVWVDAPQ